jgi:predicted GH43/DUF377 family glycosyl hydrolase
MGSPKLIVKVSTEKYETLFHRHSGNPILTGKDWPYSINSVFNAGATLLPDGSTVLLCRVEDRRGLSHFCVARSVNGADRWQNRSRTNIATRTGQIPRRNLGL